MSFELNSALALVKTAIHDLETQAKTDRIEGLHCCRLHTAIDELKRAVGKIESRIGDEYE